MSHFKLFEHWEDDLSEATTDVSKITPSLRKSLDEMGEKFESEKEIVDAIKLIGFQERSTSKAKTADHIFYDPETKKTYISFITGYVRYNETGPSWFSQEDRTHMAPISRALLPDVKDRLLLILRRALKMKGWYAAWKKSNQTLKDFLEANRGVIHAKKYGI